MTKAKSFSRQRHIRSVSSALCCLVLFQASANVAAQEWRLEPELRVGGEYDDNALLRGNPDEIFEIDGYILEGSAGIAYLTPRTTFRITPTLRSRVYDDEIDVNSDDQFLDLEWNHQTQKSEFGLNGNYSRESARTNERANADIDIDDPDDIPTDDTAILFTNQRVERFRVAPYWTYDFTERWGMEADVYYTDASYDDEGVDILRDYTDSRVSAALSRQFTERTRGFIGATARRYDTEQGTDVDGVGAGIGFESDLSETTRFHAEVGFEDTDQDDLTGTQSDSNIVANVNLVRNLETVTMLAQYRRNLNATGAGRVSVRDSINLNLRKQFTERVSGGLGVRVYQIEDLGDEVVVFEERDYAEIHARLQVALSRAFSVEADYTYSRVGETDFDEDADSNNVSLWLVYRPTPMVSSN